jgi:hypothetical protein
MPAVRKIINDPVYGFITIDHPLILEIISHPVRCIPVSIIHSVPTI